MHGSLSLLLGKSHLRNPVFQSRQSGLKYRCQLHLLQIETVRTARLKLYGFGGSHSITPPKSRLGPWFLDLVTVPHVCSWPGCQPPERSGELESSATDRVARRERRRWRRKTRDMLGEKQRFIGAHIGALHFTRNRSSRRPLSQRPVTSVSDSMTERYMRSRRNTQTAMSAQASTTARRSS